MTPLVVHEGIVRCLSDIAMTSIDAKENAPVPRDGARCYWNGTMRRYVYPICVGLGVTDYREVLGVPCQSDAAVGSCGPGVRRSMDTRRRRFCPHVGSISRLTAILWGRSFFSLLVSLSYVLPLILFSDVSPFFSRTSW